MHLIKNYLIKHPYIYKFGKWVWIFVCIVLVTASVILAIQIGDWVASWAMRNIFGVRYSSLGKERTAIFGLVRYFLPSLFFILLSMLLNKPKKGFEIMGLVIHFKWWHILALVFVIPVFLGLNWLYEMLIHTYMIHIPSAMWKVGWGWHNIAQNSSDWGHIFFFNSMRSGWWRNNFSRMIIWTTLPYSTL